MTDIHIQIFSSYDGWEIQVLDLSSPPEEQLLKTYRWDHNDFKWGVGGEGLFADLLRELDYSVYHEEVS